MRVPPRAFVSGRGKTGRFSAPTFFHPHPTRRIGLRFVWVAKFGPTSVRVTNSLDQSTVTHDVDMPAPGADSDWSTL
jgi:hypothetical protein